MVLCCEEILIVQFGNQIYIRSYLISQKSKSLYYPYKYVFNTCSECLYIHLHLLARYSNPFATSRRQRYYRDLHLEKPVGVAPCCYERRALGRSVFIVHSPSNIKRHRTIIDSLSIDTIALYQFLIAVYISAYSHTKVGKTFTAKHA